MDDATSSKPGRYKPLAAGQASNIPFLGRTKLFARAQKAAVASSTPGSETEAIFPKLSAFLDQNPIWIWDYIKDCFRGKYSDYPTYAADGKDGIYAMRAADGGQTIRISLVGDWGTGTAVAERVAELMHGPLPDYTVHLGDVYFVGDLQETDENFLGQPVQGSQYTPVKFPTGQVGTFAMIGNHEMYGGGSCYFTQILGDRGICDTGAGEKQKASFFCLETDDWRIVALDTGYNSVGKPFLGVIPIIKNIPWVGANCALDPKILDWINTNVRPQQNKKATLLLSHHQYYSVNETAFTKAAQQLKDAFAGQEVVWIWGHEHRLSIYDKICPDGNITCWGRCLGNGGMPVKLETKTSGKHLLYIDPRGIDPPVVTPDPRKKLEDGSFAGWNGYANMTIAGTVMTIDYRDETDHTLFLESFTAGDDGGVTWKVIASPGLQAVDPR